MSKNKNNTTPTISSTTGSLRANARGFGFLLSDDGQSYYVPEKLMQRHATGDVVEAELEHRAGFGSAQVKRTRILKRPNSLWLGTPRFEDGQWLLTPDEPCALPIVIESALALDEKTVIAVKYSERRHFKSRLDTIIVAVLGERTREGFDQEYAVIKYGFTPQFNKAQAASADITAMVVPVSESGAKSSNAENVLTGELAREDLRRLPFVTIDSDDTMDFDDAVYAQKGADGSFELKVAIADVSYFVRPGTPLDHAAQRRATSLYLPGVVVPMLPNVLSQGICSLRPLEDRFALVAHLTIDATGLLTAYRFQRALIRSAARLTYQQVQAWIEGAGALPSSTTESVTTLCALFKTLYAAREARGKFNFDDKDPILVKNAAGEPELQFETRLTAHLVVEELMVIANHAAALQLRDAGAQGLFRHQKAPDELAASRWFEWLALYQESTEAHPLTMKHLADEVLHAQSQGRGLEASLTARSIMTSASYSCSSSEHFSLGFSAYTHFTSPIRRYADLLVHRMLLNEATPAEVSQHVDACTDAASRARQAERYVWDRIKRKNVLAKVPAQSEVNAYLVFNTRRGVRVVLSDWQCSAWIDAKWLEQIGITFNQNTQGWESEGHPLMLGATMVVTIDKLVDDKGMMELFVRPKFLKN